MRTHLFGADAGELRAQATRHSALEIVEDDPEVVVCYGGDGTLLSAERQWPGVPKVPIRNSRRGNRCIAHPASEVLARLASGQLVSSRCIKIACIIRHSGDHEPELHVTAMNEINVHMGRINSAVRFVLWLGEDAYEGGREILGDGLVVSTPFGSTAYFCHITRGVFHTGIGIAFQNTTEHVNHLIVPEDTPIRVLITRGPAMLAYDNAPEYCPIREGHELSLRKCDRPATLLTWHPMPHPSDDF